MSADLCDVIRGTLGDSYRVGAELTGGGMSRVYTAQDLTLDRRIVIKVLPPELCGVMNVERFKREIRVAAGLQHPHIVPVLSTGEMEGMPYYTMPFVEGETLGERLHRTGPLAPREAIGILRDVARALAYAHDRQIIHRDIKPDNIMLSGGSAVVTDFGIAKAISLSRDVSGGHTLTQIGTVMGTPAYMAPEQVAGDPSLDHRADIYAFGCLAYEVLTGRPPFVEASMHQMFAAHLSAVPDELEAVAPGVPGSFAALVMQCLAKQPAERPPSAHVLLDRIEMLTSGGELALAAPATPGRGRAIPVGSGAPVALPRILSTRAGLWVVLLLVALANLVQTTLDEPLARLTGVLARRDAVSRAMLVLESGVPFAGQDMTSTLGAYSATVAYFFLFPALLVAIGVALARRPAVSALRTLVVAVACNYGISLLFFLFFPVAERWSVPESGATLLSNRWSVRLIEWVRPMSGLDNSFPSFHVSLMVVGVLLCFLFGLRHRWVAAFGGLAVILSTYLLGIHWIADILAGLAVGVISVAVAARFERRLATAAPSTPRQGNPVRSLAILALLVLPGPLAGQNSLTFSAVALDAETRLADDRLRRYLEETAGVALVAEDAAEYSQVINYLATRRPGDGSYLARVTPYALVAAELLGANVQVLGTYVSEATTRTTYQSYFVVARDRFPRPPELQDLVRMLRTAPAAMRFGYHSEFSTSSYFLPALFFRENDIFDMASGSEEAIAIRARQVPGGSSDLVRAVAAGDLDLAAVWSGTVAGFQQTPELAAIAARVYFVPLPEMLPNDLLVAAGALDSTVGARIRAALTAMPDGTIRTGDFRTWKHINDAPEARTALANLRWLARAAPAPVTVDVQRAGPDRTAIPDAYLLAVRQAVRLTGMEFVNFDRDYHRQQDYVLTLAPSHDGSVILRTRIVGADAFDQEFPISFRDTDGLMARVAEVLRSRVHRVRYLWPYRTTPPTILRDMPLDLRPGTTVSARMIRWLDTRRHAYTQGAEFEAQIAAADHSKVELSPSFVEAADADGFGFNPMSNISYRIILPREVEEPLLFRILTVALVGCLALAAIAAMVDLRGEARSEKQEARGKR